VRHIELAAPHAPRAPRAPRVGAALVFVALVALLSGCKTSTSDARLKWIEPGEVSRTMTERSGTFGLGRAPDGVFVDPRSENAFILGRIPGAVHVPLPQIEALYPTLRDRTVIVVYDSDFDDVVARAASKRLIELGHRNVRTLRGGLRAWERDGNTVERGAVAPAQAPAD